MEYDFYTEKVGNGAEAYLVGVISLLDGICSFLFFSRLITVTENRGGTGQFFFVWREKNDNGTGRDGEIKK